MFNISAENENKQHSFDLYCKVVWWNLITVSKYILQATIPVGGLHATTAIINRMMHNT